MSTKRYHISSSGNPERCRALLRPCPLSELTAHGEFGSKAEARVWAEETLAAEFSAQENSQTAKEQELSEQLAQARAKLALAKQNEPLTEGWPSPENVHRLSLLMDRVMVSDSLGMQWGKTAEVGYSRAWGIPAENILVTGYGDIGPIIRWEGSLISSDSNAQSRGLSPEAFRTLIDLSDSEAVEKYEAMSGTPLGTAFAENQKELLRTGKFLRELSEETFDAGQNVRNPEVKKNIEKLLSHEYPGAKVTVFDSEDEELPVVAALKGEDIIFSAGNVTRVTTRGFIRDYLAGEEDARFVADNAFSRVDRKDLEALLKL